MRVFVLACAAAMFVCPALSQAPRLPDICKCTATSGPTDVRECSKYDATGCSNHVVVRTSNQKCEVELPFCVICVRRLDREPMRLVQWVLSAAGYAFNFANGIVVEGSGVGKRDFELPKRLKEDTFKWDAGPDVSERLSLYPTVYENRAPCDLVGPKPIIVNTDQ